VVASAEEAGDAGAVIDSKCLTGMLFACEFTPNLATISRNTLIGRDERGGTMPASQKTRSNGRDVVIRYGFNIKTKHGQRVDNILIMAATAADAERRLRQMYHHCEILDCREQSVPRRLDTLDIEGVIGLISAGPPTLQNLGTQ
jgi:hypothetical protein